MKGEKTMECCICKDLKDQFGNFVFCPFLRRFVDWEYWHGTCPEDCPKKSIEKESKDNEL